MTKKVQMLIMMESELRDEFMAIATEHHRPAAQIIRDLMRLYIAQSRTPNALNAKTITQSRKGENVLTSKSATQLFEQLGI